MRATGGAVPAMIACTIGLVDEVFALKVKKISEEMIADSASRDGTLACVNRC